MEPLLVTERASTSTRHHSAHTRECSLDRAPHARKAEVVRVDADKTTARQLAQLGILVGAYLRVVREAPMGGPILVRVSGSEVALGRGLARHVWVKLY